MTLLRDLITIPEQVFKGDFVLKLVEGVTEPERTLKDYVVTPQLVSAFDQALGLIKSALEGKQSKAAFLHGSFGSGKSHFMAVLHLLLAQDKFARAIPELAPQVAKHGWLAGKKFLLVPFHMIGAKSLESAIFGQYVRHVGALHPKDPVPAVFLGDDVLQQADMDRQRHGDEEFFRILGAGQGGWGNLHAWNAERYDTARSAPPNDEARKSLISAIVTNLLPIYRKVVSSDGEAYVTLDEGLVTLTQHAKDLGYHGLVFFLDEVILWLASMAGDLGFVNEQGAKLVKLIESQGERRAIPLISILARQRDLRELVGEHIPGSEKLAVFDVLKHGTGRFDTIKLEDRNLPVILEKRLLRPKSELARSQLDTAFVETKKIRKEIHDILLTQGFGEEAFRRVYPFSPALIDTLIHVSSVLQRERTAIKVLMQLLVTQRDTLEVGQLVPVGDLFDVIADGDEPFSEGMRMHFENAKKLYVQKLRPTVLHQHGLNEEHLSQLPINDMKRKAFLNDDRLVKTLLLAALVPQVESLRGMTAGRLVALNHGTIKAPIQGQETGLVLQKVRAWASAIGEVRLTGDNANPTIHLEIGSVDTESIVAKVSRQDSPGARRAKVRDLLYEQFAITPEGAFREEYKWVWRGTRRSLDVVYGNVRELPVENLQAKDDRWLLVIDYPFDDGYTPDDDLRRIDEVRKRGSTRTVCWIPAFLSREALADLGKLVVLDYLLNENNEQRFLDNASHLAPVERIQAKTLLDGQRSALKQKILRAMDAAYGIANAEPWMLGAPIEVADRFQCLDASQQQLARPVVATLRQGLEALGDQMLGLQYPKHPNFGGENKGFEIKGAAVKRVFECVQRAARDPLHRTIVEKERRREVREIVEPLELGEMSEDALRLKDYWQSLLDRHVAQSKGDAITVGRLRQWIEEQPRGLPREVQDLVILTYAEVGNRRFLKLGGSYLASIERGLDNDLELREQQLPSEKDWEAAREHAAAFGIDVGSQRGPANVGKLIEDVKALVASGAPACRNLEQDLRQRLEMLDVRCADAPRWLTAQAVVALCGDVLRGGDEMLVENLAKAEATHSWQAMGTSFKQAAAVRQTLVGTEWSMMETAWSMGDQNLADAQALKQRVVDVLKQDEHVTTLAPALRSAMTEASGLLRRLVKAPSATPPVQSPPIVLPAGKKPETPVVPPPAGKREVEANGRGLAKVEDLRKLCSELEAKLGSGKRSIELTWRIFEEDGRR
jgi:hypothetical protein